MKHETILPLLIFVAVLFAYIQAIIKSNKNK